MKPFGQGLAIAGLSLFALVAAGPASAQKSGGVLKIEHFDSPASMSILEEFDARRVAADDGGVQQPGRL